MTDHVSDLQLDARRLGHSDADVETHLSTCAHCAARGQMLDEQASAISNRMDAPTLAAQTLMRLEEQTTPMWRKILWPSVAVAGAIAAAFVLAFPATNGIRTKGGGPRIDVFVASGDESALVSGPVAADGALRVRVSTDVLKHVRLLWSSAPKSWSALYPIESAEAWPVTKVSWLDREVVLDGAPEPERLGVVFCEAPVSHEDAVHVLNGDDNQIQDARCTSQTVLVEKR